MKASLQYLRPIWNLATRVGLCHLNLWLFTTFYLLRMHLSPLYTINSFEERNQVLFIFVLKTFCKPPGLQYIFANGIIIWCNQDVTLPPGDLYQPALPCSVKTFIAWEINHYSKKAEIKWLFLDLEFKEFKPSRILRIKLVPLTKQTKKSKNT